MSKIFKPFVLIIKVLYYIIDRFLVMPISRFVFRMSELNRANSGRFEKFLNRPNILVYISLFCAISIFLLIDSQAINLVTSEAVILPDQPVTVIFNEEAYVVEGVPETVDITLIGRKSDLYLARQLGEHSVVLDLTGYGVGSYRVRLNYNHSIKSVNYRLDPSTVPIRIMEKVNQVKPITFDILNETSLASKLSIKDVRLDRSEVIVRGSAEALASVASVRALIDMETAGLTEQGSFAVDSNVIVAYDAAGVKIDNVEIVPARISAIVEIESFSASKPVRIVTRGDITPGFALATAISSITRVDVYGDEETIKNLSYVEAVIDVTGLNAARSFNVTLTRPAGVRYMSETRTTIEVTVDRETSREINDILVNSVNLGTQYTAQIPLGANRTVSVIAQGVANVLNNLDLSATPITAEVDLSGLTPGTHDVPVRVFINDIRVKLTPKVQTVQVVIRAR